jgi:hypothetical protein
MIMRGTIIKNLRLTKAVDGDTIKVLLDGQEESLRLACLDTEESWPGGTKPVTEAGRRASQWAKEWFGVKFNLWIPNRESPAAIRILRLVNNRYAGQGRGYVVVTGEASRYPDNDDGKPQIILSDAAQLSDLHSG